MDTKYNTQISKINFSRKNYTITDFIPILDFDDAQKICIEISEKLTQILEKYI